MIYTSIVQDTNNINSYSLQIKTPGSNTYKEIYLMQEKPIVITYENMDDIFEPIKTYSATINILTKEYLFDLYNINREVTVQILKVSNPIFFGYVTPNIYSTSYENYSQISVECISPIAMLKYEDYTTINPDKRDVYSILDIIVNCLKKTRFNINQYLYVDNIFNFNGPQSGTKEILRYLKLDENNFFDDNDEQTPWKCYDVLAEICRYLNLTLYEYGSDIYLVNYRSLVNSQVYSAIKYYINTNGEVSPVAQSVTLDSKYVIDQFSFASSDNSLSLSETYKRIKVKCNTYPYEDIFTDLMDTQYWSLATGYQSDNPFTYSKIPKLIHSTSNSKNGYYNYFWFYFTSELLSPLKWVHSVTPYTDPEVGTPLTNSTTDWMQNYIQRTPEIDVSAWNNVGVSLMQTATYEVTDPTLVSSLSWNKNLVLYTGIGNYGTTWTNYGEDHYNKSHELATKVGKYLNWCSANVDDVVNAYLCEMTSKQQIQITKDSYLVLDGRMMYSASDFEDPSIKEYTGYDKHEKAAFKYPFSYEMIDNYQSKKDKKVRAYFGFPMINIQIEIGDQILVAYDMYDEDNDIYGQIYEWETKGTTHDAHVGEEGFPTGDGTTIITIPVGTNEMAWFKMMDITNTCDWRLGINNGKGFAIPLKIGLSGYLTVRIINADAGLLYTPRNGGSYFINTLKNLRKHAGLGQEDLNKWINVYDHMCPYTDNEWLIEYNKVYKGYYPNCIIINGLSIKIYDVVYNSALDMTEKVDNKNSDQEYMNVINENSIEDYDDIELKINTQAIDKNFSFSSVLYDAGNQSYKPITDMSVDSGNTYAIQELNIIDGYVEHYRGPKAVFECDLLMNENKIYEPYALFNTSFRDNYFILNGAEVDLKTNSMKCTLVEF